MAEILTEFFLGAFIIFIVLPVVVTFFEGWWPYK